MPQETLFINIYIIKCLYIYCIINTYKTYTQTHIHAQTYIHTYAQTHAPTCHVHIHRNAHKHIHIHIQSYTAHNLNRRTHTRAHNDKNIYV
jgi:hypothetical protein